MTSSRNRNSVSSSSSSAPHIKQHTDRREIKKGLAPGAEGIIIGTNPVLEPTKWPNMEQHLVQLGPLRSEQYKTNPLTLEGLLYQRAGHLVDGHPPGALTIKGDRRFIIVTEGTRA
jgi:hypothetical protein